MRNFLLTALLSVAWLCACQSDTAKMENRRTPKVKQWLGLGQEINAAGFSVRSGNTAYGSPYVLEREFFVELDQNAQYAIEAGPFAHQCGPDTRVSREFALAGSERELVVARNFAGIRGFDQIPDGFVRLLALVFTEHPCQVDYAKFSLIKASLTNDRPDTGDEPRIEPSPLGPAPAELFHTTWLRQAGGQRDKWVFEFAGDGTGRFGFRVEDLTIRLGKFRVGSDATIDEAHMVLEITRADELPDDAPWQEHTVHYCRYRLDGALDARVLELVCSAPDELFLPEVAAAIDAYAEIPDAR